MHCRLCSIVCKLDHEDKATALLSSSVVHLSSSTFFSGIILLDSSVITQQHASLQWHQPAIYIQIRIRWIRNGSFLVFWPSLPHVLPLFSLHSLSLLFSWANWGQVSTNVTWLPLKASWMSLSKCSLKFPGAWVWKNFWEKNETYLILIRVPMGPVNSSTITTLIKHLKTGK